MLHKSSKSKNFFQGDEAVKSFLTPGAMGPTPVVELPKELNPFHKDKVRIFIKLTQFVPLGNIKSLPSYKMLENIPKKDLPGIKHLIEYSSGNTALSLTIFSKHFGIPNMHAIITPDVPEHKKRLLQLAGTNLLISHGVPSPGVFANEGGIYDAKVLGKQKGWHNFNQYINPGNWQGARDYVGKELWKQFGTDLSVLMTSIGTAGTVYGAGSYLKNKNKKMNLMAAAIKDGYEIPGPRGEVMIHQLGIPWKDVVDEVIPVNTENAFLYSLKLIRLGLFVGPSTGMQLWALISKLTEYKKKKKLSSLRNSDGEIICCFVACDTMFAYIDEYFDVLPSSHFPRITDI